MPKRFEDMTEGELSDVMVSAARAVTAVLPKKALFVLVCFDDPKIAQYISNAERAGVISSMRETAERLEKKQEVQRVAFERRKD